MRHRTGIVVIGRNEGERLIASLKSVCGHGCPVVYVDSGSSDNSAARAREMGVSVVELDAARPFSAARARNEGFAAVTANDPTLVCVQFLDGDCTLLPGWIEGAAQAMASDPLRAVVIGPLQERLPDASVYNRLCAMEWKSPAGDLTNFGALGGIMLVRAEVFARLAGFNEQVIAGEDSEFGVRVGLAGLKITKIDASMATHDADIHRFGQWWRRSVRAGHAIGQRFSLNGRTPPYDCARERRSVLFWGLGLPITSLALSTWTAGTSLLMLVVAYPVLAARIARHRLNSGESRSDAWLYARFVVIAKFAEALGLIKYHTNRIAGRFRIIEYK